MLPYGVTSNDRINEWKVTKSDIEKLLLSSAYHYYEVKCHEVYSTPFWYNIRIAFLKAIHMPTITAIAIIIFLYPWMYSSQELKAKKLKVMIIIIIKIYWLEWPYHMDTARTFYTTV